MRKLTILALVVILAGALSVVGFAQSSDVMYNVNQGLSLTLNGDTVDFGSVNTGATYNTNVGDATGSTLSVTANSNLSWEITTSVDMSSVTNNPDLTVFFEGNTETTNYTGTGTESSIAADYKLVVPDNAATGNHTITVTFTLSPNMGTS